MAGSLDTPGYPNMSSVKQGPSSGLSALTYGEVGARCVTCGKFRGRRLPTTDRTRRIVELLRSGKAAPMIAGLTGVSVSRVHFVKRQWTPELITRKSCK